MDVRYQVKKVQDGIAVEGLADEMLQELAGMGRLQNRSGRWIISGSLQAFDDFVTSRYAPRGGEAETEETSPTHPPYPAGIGPTSLSRLVKSGYLERGADGELTRASTNKLEDLTESHYFLSQRLDHLAKEAGITRATLNQKIYSRRIADDFTTNLGGESRGRAVYVYRKQDEPRIIAQLKGREARAREADSGAQEGVPPPERALRSPDDLHPSILGKLVASGRLERDACRNITPESWERFQAFMEGHYLLIDRMSYLAEQTGRGEHNLRATVAVNADARRLLINLGIEGRGSILYAYPRSDEPKLIETMRSRKEAGSGTSDFASAMSPKDLHAAVRTRLVKGGHLRLDREGNVTPASWNAFRKYMEGRHFLAEREEYLAQQAGVTMATLSNKLHQGVVSNAFLENLGGRGKSERIYAYRNDQEPVLIEALRKRRPFGRSEDRQATRYSGRRLRELRDLDLGDASRMKLIDVEGETHLSEELLGEFMDRLQMTTETVDVRGLVVKTMRVEDYKRLRGYLWELRRPPTADSAPSGVRPQKAAHREEEM